MIENLFLMYLCRRGCTLPAFSSVSCVISRDFPEIFPGGDISLRANFPGVPLRSFALSFLPLGRIYFVEGLDIPRSSPMCVRQPGADGHALVYMQ